MKDYTNENPIFSESIRVTETSDPAHADNINMGPIQVFQNTLFNRNSIEKIKKGMGDKEEYNADHVYQAGDYCQYQGILYKCVQDTDGEWNPECWKQTNAIDEISDINTPTFEDYCGEGAEVPGAREAIARIQSKKGLTSIISNIKAALMGLVTLGEIRGLLVNNGLCSEAGKFFLDAAYGKNLQDQLTKLNSDSFHYKGTITTGDDLNNYKTIGCYRYNGKPSNTPSSTSDWGELCVFKSDNYIVQTAFAGLSRMFSRHVDPPSGIWTQWIEYAPKSDLGEWGGYKIIKTGVTDLNNPPSAFIIQTIAGTSIPGYPSGFGGNTVLALQLYPGRSDYGAQLAFSFGMDKIAIRRKSESTTWSDWKYFTAS